MDFAALADARDPDSRDTYLSVYADLTDERHERALESRLKEVRAALGKDAAAAIELDGAWARAREALHRVAQEQDAQGAVAFVSAVHDHETAEALARPVPTTLVVDSSPFVRPLARYRDEYESFVLVLMDGTRAGVFLVDEARATKEGSRKLDLMGRHKKGGWSQMRYQRARQGVVDRFMDDIGERVAKLLENGDADRVIVAGPGQVKHRFVSALPAPVAEKVIAVEDVDFTGDDESDLVARFVTLAKRQESESSVDAVTALRTELKKGELALTGPFATARAARDGRVGLLVILKDTVAGGRKCEKHRTFFAAEETCPIGGEPGTEVDLVNEAVEGALRADARVEFVDRNVPKARDQDGPKGGVHGEQVEDFLREIGGVGAVLRW